MLEGSFLERFVNMEQLTTLSENAMDTITSFVQENAGKILNTAANSGKGILTMVIALILAVYLLMDKKRVLSSWCAPSAARRPPSGSWTSPCAATPSW